MAGLTSNETQQVEAANASGKAPVVFVHGLWLLPSSWDRWQAVFDDYGSYSLGTVTVDPKDSRIVCGSFSKVSLLRMSRNSLTA